MTYDLCVYTWLLYSMFRSMAKVVSPSQQLLHIEPVSDTDRARWPRHRARAYHLILHFQSGHDVSGNIYLFNEWVFL